MKNSHLLPQVVSDLGAKVASKTVTNNERIQYILRLEAIRNYCNEILTKETVLKLSGK